MVCERLPIESEYYGWLAFAPSDTQKWRNYVKEVIRVKDWKHIDLLLDVKPEGFDMTAPEIRDLLKQYSPEEIRRLNENWVTAIKRWLPTADPKFAAQIFSDMPPEKLATMIPPEKRLAGLSPEERLAGLSPEEVEAWLKKQSKNFENNKEQGQQ